MILLFLFNSAQTWPAGKSAEPFGSKDAVRGGELSLRVNDFPKSFNYFVNNASDASEVFAAVYDTLLEMDPTTLEFQPLLAKSWTISKDKKEFTFILDPSAKWADGKPVTAEDVKFTYDVIMDTNNMTIVQRMGYSRFYPPVILDSHSIKFTAKMVHFNNFVNLAGFTVLPKHLFEGKDFNKSFNMNLPAGSGPYILSEVREGRYYTLTRRKDYWADSLPSHRGTYNFERIKYKVIRDDNVAFEGFKKGDFDIIADDISAKRWATETGSEPFQKNWIVKHKVYNYYPRGFSGIALNLRKPLFQDIRVRKALFMLLDRKDLIEKIMYNQYEPLSSYWPSLYGPKGGNNPVSYDPEKAKKLLREAGYTKLDREGYLINKKGERMEFTLSYSGDSFEKHLTLYADSCRQAGVKINLELLSWATLLKKMEQYNFDSLIIAWSTSLFEDPEQLWHSRYADVPGGSDLPGFKNKKVDAYIDSLPPLFDADERINIIKNIDKIIYEETPYILMWGANYSRLLYKNIFGMPKTFLSKYGSTHDVINYWWFDPEKEKKYDEAKKNNIPLPPEPVEVYYDKLAK